LRAIIALIIVLVVAAITVFNMHPENEVVIRLASREAHTSGGILFLIAWLLGVVSYAILALLGDIRLHTRLARQKRENESLLRELNDLRNLPVNAEDEVKGEEAAEEKR
jgi:Mn2+/Fe2+ NRAMP family transporter